MKKIVKMLGTIELAGGDLLIGDATYTLDGGQADSLLKDGRCVLIAEVPDKADKAAVAEKAPDSDKRTDAPRAATSPRARPNPVERRQGDRPNENKLD